jgi:hypothetical protein
MNHVSCGHMYKYVLLMQWKLYSFKAENSLNSTPLMNPVHILNSGMRVYLTVTGEIVQCVRRTMWSAHRVKCQLFYIPLTVTANHSSSSSSSSLLAGFSQLFLGGFIIASTAKILLKAFLASFEHGRSFGSGNSGEKRGSCGLAILRVLLSHV